MDKQFGSHIRGLRKQKDLSLRRLAEEAALDFTYLSKVETGRTPPPSEDAIVRLAEVLDADRDELLSLAKKVDRSLHEFLVTEPDAPRLLRAWSDGRLDEAKKIIEKNRDPKKDGDAKEP